MQNLALSQKSAAKEYFSSTHLLA